MVEMAVAAKKLDVQLGDVVEIDGRRYDIVSDKQGGVALEPAITTSVADIHAEHGGRPVTQTEFDELFGDLPSDGEASGSGVARVAVRISPTTWREEVDRLDRRSPSRAAAERERQHLEQEGLSIGDLQSCAAKGPDGTKLKGLVKVYVPIMMAPASQRPFGFVFSPGRDDHGPHSFRDAASRGELLRLPLRGQVSERVVEAAAGATVPSIP